MRDFSEDIAAIDALVATGDRAGAVTAYLALAEGFASELERVAAAAATLRPSAGRVFTADAGSAATPDQMAVLDGLEQRTQDALEIPVRDRCPRTVGRASGIRECVALSDTELSDGGAVLMGGRYWELVGTSGPEAAVLGRYGTPEEARESQQRLAREGTRP